MEKQAAILRRLNLRERLKNLAPEPALVTFRWLRQIILPGRMRARRFTDIYRTNAWQDEQSASGSGSNLEQTQILRAELPELLRRFSVRSLLDAPCGDLYWVSQADLPLERYIGADIVPELIQRHQRKFDRPDWSFLVADITKDDLPQVDAVMCRDCLVHLSFKDALAAIRNLKSSGSEYLLTTHFITRDTNKDIETGDWRPLNLTLPPFRFPEPLALINEQCTELGGIYSDKCMALWRIQDLPD